MYLDITSDAMLLGSRNNNTWVCQRPNATADNFLIPGVEIHDDKRDKRKKINRKKEMRRKTPVKRKDKKNKEKEVGKVAVPRRKRLRCPCAQKRESRFAIEEKKDLRVIKETPRFSRQYEQLEKRKRRGIKKKEEIAREVLRAEVWGCTAILPRPFKT